MSDEKAATVTEAPPTTGGWTDVLPETFGIREAVRNNPFRWCVRESFMWGIATGTAMGLHRLRMKSHPFFAFNVAFGTSLLVAAPSYYFCFRRREYKEQTIELMMKANDFAHEDEMPEPVPVEEHPFMAEGGGSGEESEKNLRKEYVARLKERKEWQKAPPMEERDPSKVFKEVGK
mmetsp:Transcript_25556/g.55870  ORF Transcript_25556/g.55870 Transcript_25556/m.55870 type:complete len:176 (+) Transcript_25556:257-784(+)